MEMKWLQHVELFHSLWLFLLQPATSRFYWRLKMHLFNKYLLRTKHVPGFGLGTGDALIYYEEEIVDDVIRSKEKSIFLLSQLQWGSGSQGYEIT